MNKYLKIFFVFTIVANVLFSLWYLLHGDIYFHTDIARDFLLLDDLLNRKLVLIGPRASGLDGFYHGPLWMYINLPAYLIGKGNPLVVGWFWFILYVSFLVSSFFIAKKIFNKEIALIFVALLSLFPSIPNPQFGQQSGYYNPFGAAFLMPLFFYFLYQYSKHLKLQYLLGFLFLNGCIVQFQIAFGGPLLILTTLYTLYLIVRHRKFVHILGFFILALPFSTYILFDIRHNFSHLRAIFVHDPNKFVVVVPLLEVIKNRLGMAFFSALHFFREPYDVFNLFFAFAIAFGYYFIFTSKKKVDTRVYVLAALIYLGYFVLSIVHLGWLMYFYWMPLYPLVLLIFSSLVNVLPKKLFYSLVIFAIAGNLFISYRLAVTSDQFIGKDQDSWKFQSSLAQKVFTDANGRTFGFYIYSPDIFAYQSKYPFAYLAKLNPQTKMHIYERMPLTYIVMAPAPHAQPWMTGEWWLKNKVGIVKQPQSISEFDNGYKIMKFSLDKKDLETPTDPNLNDWIYFR